MAVLGLDPRINTAIFFEDTEMPASSAGKMRLGSKLSYPLRL
jgi:hypothetical protein